MNVQHVCRTSNGEPIRLGLRVRDYDNRIGTVVEAPRNTAFDDPVCWPARDEDGTPHNGHWWGVCEDRPGHRHQKCRGKLFDGSRMTTAGVGR